MSQTQDLISVLSESFAQAKAKNSSYSMRSFAKKLGLPPSTLSSLLSGKLPVTRRMAERILPRLSVDPQTAQVVIQAADLKADPTYAPIDMDHYRLISDWQCIAILSLVETDDFISDEKWMARRLGLTVRALRSAVERLVRLELLKRDEHAIDGKGLVRTGQPLATTNGVANLSLRKTNFENIELARRSLEECELHACDFTAITMAIDPEKLPEAKRMITRFRRELCAFMESGKKQEVYRMFVSLFPLTQLEKGKK